MIVRAIKRVGREAAYVGFRLAVRLLPSPEFDPAQVRKILVPVYMGIGNVVLFEPAMRAIRARFPDAEIVMATGNSRSNDEVLGPGLVDRVLRIPLEGSFASRRENCRRLRAERFDLSISTFLCNQPYIAFFTAYARIPWRCGHVSSPGWNGNYDFLFNLPVLMQRDQHEIDRYLELAAALGAWPASGGKHPRFPIAAETHERAATLLTRHGIGPDARLVVVHAGTSAVMRWKQWGVDRFEEVVLTLADEFPDVCFAMVGAPDEKAELADVSRRLTAKLAERFVDLAGATDIPTLAAVIARSVLLVGNDSGPMQIAAALDVPCVVPWGPSDLPRNRPLGDLHTVVFKNLPCAPCYRMPGDSKVHLCEHRLCLQSIPATEVATAASARLVTIGFRNNA